MTVRAKTLLVVGTMAVLLAAAAAWLSPPMLVRDSERLEHTLVENALVRLRQSVAGEADALDAVNWDWAAWDDAYDYMASGSAEFASGNLINESLAALRISLLMLVRTNGTVAWGRALDLESRGEVPVPADFLARLGPGQPLVCLTNEADAVSGVVSFGGRPAVVTARPIVTSREKGPVRGTLLMARVLDRSVIRRLGQLATSLDVSVLAPGSAALPADLRGPRAEAEAKGGYLTVRTDGEDTISGYALVRDLDGQPCFVWFIHGPRSLYHAERLEIATFVLILTFSCLLIGTAAFLILDRLVLRRIERLSTAVAGIRSHEVSSSRVPARGRDEVSSLAAEFNRLLDRLAESMGAQRSLQEELEQRVEERTEALRRSESELRRLYLRMETLREEERRSVAERVHDELGQLATALKMDAGWAREHAVGCEPAVAERLGEISGIAESMIQTIRDIATDLRPSVLDHFGLAAAVQASVRRIAERSGMRCDTEIDEVEVEDEAMRTALYRIAQELMGNVVRHAAAGTMFVKLAQDDACLRLEVEDDGRGIRDEELEGPTAFGLTAVRERVAALRGSLLISRRPSGGTRVHVSVALPHPEGGT